MLASGLVSNVPLAPVATKVLLGKETLCRLFPVGDVAAVQVTRSALVNIFPPLPTATYTTAPDTSPKAMLFILGPPAPPLGMEVAAVHVLPSGLVKTEPSVPRDRKSTRLNSSHGYISYAVFCLKKKKSEPHAGGHRRRATAAPVHRNPTQPT